MGAFEVFEQKCPLTGACLLHGHTVVPSQPPRVMPSIMPESRAAEPHMISSAAFYLAYTRDEVNGLPLTYSHRE